VHGQWPSKQEEAEQNPENSGGSVYHSRAPNEISGCLSCSQTINNLNGLVGNRRILAFHQNSGNFLKLSTVERLSFTLAKLGHIHLNGDEKDFSRHIEFIFPDAEA
jgi:hypothetical protein